MVFCHKMVTKWLSVTIIVFATFPKLSHTMHPNLAYCSWPFKNSSISSSANIYATIAYCWCWCYNNCKVLMKEGVNTLFVLGVFTIEWLFVCRQWTRGRGIISLLSNFQAEAKHAHHIIGIQHTNAERDLNLLRSLSLWLQTLSLPLFLDIYYILYITKLAHFRC